MLGAKPVTSLSSSNGFQQRDHTSRKPMGNAGHTSPRRSRGQHFLFMTRRVKPFLSFFLLFCYRPPPQYPVVAQRVLSRLAYVTSPRLHYITMTPRDISYELYIVAERENSSSARFQKKKEYTQPVLRCDPPRHSTAFTLLKSFLYVVVVKSTRSFRNSTYLTRSRQLPPSGDRHNMGVFLFSLSFLVLVYLLLSRNRSCFQPLSLSTCLFRHTPLSVMVSACFLFPYPRYCNTSGSSP